MSLTVGQRSSPTGYLTFGDTVPSNVINGYPKTPLVAVARTILGVVVLCNFPLQIFPSRVSLLSLIDALSPKSHGAPAGLPLRTPSMWVETAATHTQVETAATHAHVSPASESMASRIAQRRFIRHQESKPGLLLSSRKIARCMKEVQ